MKDIVADPRLVANCGLYCGACGSFRKGSCPGCHDNEGATWCGIRTCCREKKYQSCADCTTFPDPKGCSKFHNFISRIIGFFLRSDRRACILQIRNLGLQGHAEDLAKRRRHSLPRS